MEKKRSIEESNDKGHGTNLACLAVMTGHLTNLNKELKEKYKLITEMCDSMKAFKVKLQLWEKQSKLHNIFHFPVHSCAWRRGQ
jgi:hypothetical protein